METFLIVLLTALVNGAVTWGVVKTELRHLKRETDRAHLRLDAIGAPNVTVT